MVVKSSKIGREMFGLEICSPEFQLSIESEFCLGKSCLSLALSITDEGTTFTLGHLEFVSVDDDDSSFLELPESFSSTNSSSERRKTNSD